MKKAINEKIVEQTMETIIKPKLKQNMTKNKQIQPELTSIYKGSGFLKKSRVVKSNFDSQKKKQLMEEQAIIDDVEIQKKSK